MMALVSLTAAVAIMLAFLGIREGSLNLRPQPRRCPSCGRHLRSRASCSCAHSRSGR